MSEYGKLQEVRIYQRGTTLTAAAAVDDTQLVVDNAGDFNNDPDDPDNSGGTLDLNGVRLEYTGVTYGELIGDPDTILLAAPLTAAADADDSVYVVAGGQILEDWIAWITMGEGDQLPVPLSIDQRAQWSVGVYPDPVPVIVTEDLMHLEDAPGRTAPNRTQFRNTDTATWTGTGDLVILLTATPNVPSLQVKLNGHELEPGEWTYDSGAGTITIPAEDWWEADKEVGTAWYAWEGIEAAASIAPGPVLPTIVGDSQPASDPGTSTVIWDIPAEAVAGNFLVAIAAVNQGDDDVDPNGWEAIGETGYSGGSIPYKLVVLTKIYDGAPDAPVIPFGGSPFGYMFALDEGSSLEGLFANAAAGGTSADTPAGPSTLRVWVALSGNEVVLSETSGDVVASEDAGTAWTSADILVTLDASTSPVAANASGTVTTGGWLLATLAVY